MLLRAAFLLGRLIIAPLWAQSRQESSSFSLRIYYWDCDCNGHVNNARYLNFLDWARFKFFYEQRLWSFFGKKFFPIVQNTEITYVRPIYPLERCHITTKLLWWDDKYLYFDHLFFVGDELRTHARCRAVVFKGRQERQALLTLLSQAPQPPDSLAQWAHYLGLKKKESNDSS